MVSVTSRVQHGSSLPMLYGCFPCLRRLTSGHLTAPLQTAQSPCILHVLSLGSFITSHTFSLYFPGLSLALLPPMVNLLHLLPQLVPTCLKTCPNNLDRPLHDTCEALDTRFISQIWQGYCITLHYVKCPSSHECAQNPHFYSIPKSMLFLCYFYQFMYTSSWMVSWNSYLILVI